MGLDIGDRTVGLAISDEGATVATGCGVLRRTRQERDVAEVVRQAAERGAGLLVAGLPRTLAGDVGPQARKVLDFVAALRAASPVAVELWDERMTTRIAERSLAEAAVPRRRRRALVDQVAAAVILQGYLDARAARRGPAVPD